MARTIGIVGGSISGNKGAEAMVTTVIGGLRHRRPDLRFVLFSPYYRQDKPLERNYPDTLVADGGPLRLVTTTFPPALLERVVSRSGLHPARWFRESRLLSQCDLLVDLAGISFSDGREMYLPFNVLTVLPAMLLGVKVAKLSQAMGPFANRLNRRCASWLLPRCCLLVARGDQSRRHVQSLGLHCEIGPDIAFALNDLLCDPQGDDDSTRHVGFGTASRRLVGISPSSVVYQSCRRAGLDYVGVLADVVRQIVGLGYRVILLPHGIRPNSDKLKNNDLPVVRWIRDCVGLDESVRAVEEDLDSIALRRLIGRCDFFIASRFHSMVAALATGVPVLVCGWGHKYLETLEMFGQHEYALDFSQVTADRLMDGFGRLVTDEQAIRRSLCQSLPAVLDGARRQLDAVIAALEESRETAP